MLKKIHIDVTAEDIALGRPGDSMACPIARALKRVLNKKIVSIYDTLAAWDYAPILGTRLDRREKDFAIINQAIPGDLLLIIKKYDRSHVMTPFTMEFEIEARTQDNDDYNSSFNR